jgi:C-terminal peptidase prc
MPTGGALVPRLPALRARWQRFVARGLALVMASVLVAGCAGASNAGPTGNSLATIPDEPAPAGQGGQSGPGGSGGSTPPGVAVAPTALIPPAELGAVYQQIVERYVGQVDHARLVESAVAAVQQASQQVHALPPDRAPVDLLPQPTGDPEDDWGTFARAYNQMVGKHPRWAAQTRPDRAVLRGMLASLQDDTALLIEPTDVMTTGDRITGIGISMTKPAATEPPHVTEVHGNSPAANAGLRPGDQILAVNGAQTADLTTSQVSRMMRGQEGTAVTLSVQRGSRQPVDIRITRANVNILPIDFTVRPDGFAVMRIRAFTEQGPELVQRLLTVGQNQGIRGWVIDLRGNTGGSIESMAMIATHLLDRRPVAFAVDRSGQRSGLQASNRPAIGRFPFALVVDRATTSWGEVLAASVKEYQAGPVIGARTAGNVGLFTQPLSDGSAVQLMVLKMETPNGVPIDTQGVQPDVEAIASVTDLQNGDDPPVRRAIEALMQAPGRMAR